MNSRRLGAHFVIVTLATFLVIFTSITIATFIGLPSSPAIAVQLLIIIVAHISALFIAFNIRTNFDLDVRVNPYVTFCEAVFHKRLQWSATLIELFGQLIGSTAASLLFYGITEPADFIGSLVIGSVGPAFGLEIVAGLFISWVYFHNYYYKNSVNLPLIMATIVGVTSGVVFPYIGATTHNPLRYLAACIPAGSCDKHWWIYIVGPFIGMVIGYFIHNITINSNRKNEQCVWQ